MDCINENCSFYRRINYTPSANDKNLLFYFDWAGHFVCNPNFYIDRVKYKSYLVLCTLSGSGRLNYDGNEYILSKNSVVFLDCRKRHIYHPLDGQWEFCFMHIDGSNVSELYEQYKKNGVLLLNCPTAVPKYIFSVLDMYSKTGNFGYSFSDYIYRILCALLNGASGFASDNIPGDILKAVGYINEHIEEPIVISDISDYLNFSRVYFSKRFKKYMGITPKEYILNRRIIVAKEMLISNTLSIEEIALKSGFSCSSAFIRAFKSVTSTTPLAYKNSFIGDTKNSL